MSTRSLVLVSLLAGSTASASAQSLNGLDVHAWYNVDGNAEYGLIDETTRVGPGAEFRFDGFGSSGYFESADFDGSTLTLTLFMGQSTIKSEVTSWWFQLSGDRDFTSFTLLSDNIPRSVSHTIRDNGLAVFGIGLWHESEAVPPGSTFTATYQVAFSDTTNPIPEPSTYALMFTGLAVVAGIAGKKRRRA
jgi:hypothetical protein